MKKTGKVCAVIAALVLSACSPYPPFGDLSAGALTVQGAAGYKGSGPHLAVTAQSKHYQFSASTNCPLYDGNEHGARGNNDGRLNPGETVIYRIDAANYGRGTTSTIGVVISTADKYISGIENTRGSIGTFFGANKHPPESKAIFEKNIALEKNLKFTVSPDTPPGHIVKFNIAFSDNGGNSWNDYFLITVSPLPD